MTDKGDTDGAMPPAGQAGVAQRRAQPTARVIVEFAAEAIRLRDRTGSVLGEAPIGETGQPEGIDGLVRLAAERSDGAQAPPVILWLPDDQVAISTPHLPDTRRERALGAVAAAMAKTGQPAAELAIAIAPRDRPDGRATVFAAYAQTVREARAYAEGWGFQPLRVANGEMTLRAGTLGLGLNPLDQLLPPRAMGQTPAPDPATAPAPDPTTGPAADPPAAGTTTAATGRRAATQPKAPRPATAEGAAGKRLKAARAATPPTAAPARASLPEEPDAPATHPSPEASAKPKQKPRRKRTRRGASNALLGLLLLSGAAGAGYLLAPPEQVERALSSLAALSDRRGERAADGAPQRPQRPTRLARASVAIAAPVRAIPLDALTPPQAPLPLARATPAPAEPADRAARALRAVRAAPLPAETTGEVAMDSLAKSTVSVEPIRPGPPSGLAAPFLRAGRTAGALGALTPAPATAPAPGPSVPTATPEPLGTLPGPVEATLAAAPETAQREATETGTAVAQAPLTETLPSGALDGQGSETSAEEAVALAPAGDITEDQPGPSDVPAEDPTAEAQGEGPALAPTEAAPQALDILPPRRPVSETETETAAEEAAEETATATAQATASDTADGTGADAGTAQTAAQEEIDASPLAARRSPAPTARPTVEIELPRVAIPAPPPRSTLATLQAARLRETFAGETEAMGSASSPADDATLIGVMFLDGQRQALMRLGNGTYHRVGIGDAVGEWTISEIEDEAIRLDYEGETRVYPLISR